MDAIWDVLSSDVTYSSAMRFAALLLFAASGEWVAERAGTLNISIEGMLLSGAFASAVSIDLVDSMWLALLAGSLAGLLLSTVQANLSHRLPADQFVVGLTINILVLGLVGFLDDELNPSVSGAGIVEIPILSDIPLVRPGPSTSSIPSSPRCGGSSTAPDGGSRSGRPVRTPTPPTSQASG
jgi:general nucleoside transport system permease protein